ncbi:uncharacterized protein LAESUDRAFT_712483 [Laetiporus sulphureus 93-53]|uniref:Uncharacterized protein n=1 Tax=Laetiporus sulphureus 93-53 TaxID=1314785 RepID=A0A165FEI3_9APHY|nr:uncharacterized protein LAESUDRAFT_712483 [Laetiporus sulphureus 93-53]KZT08849.1 hypothetical protein LAESUDRAFT_712483 [Laetiporus sulphureus 93-53]
MIAVEIMRLRTLADSRDILNECHELLTKQRDLKVQLLNDLEHEIDVGNERKRAAENTRDELKKLLERYHGQRMRLQSQIGLMDHDEAQSRLLRIRSCFVLRCKFVAAHISPLRVVLRECGAELKRKTRHGQHVSIVGHILCASCAHTLISDGSTCPLKDSEQQIEEHDLTVVALVFETAGEKKDLQSYINRSMTLLKTEQQLIEEYSSNLQPETTALYSSVRMQEAQIDDFRNTAALLSQEVIKLDGERVAIRYVVVWEVLPPKHVKISAFLFGHYRIGELQRVFAGA